MGTSLVVQPFAGLLQKVSKKCIRLLINREEVGTGFQMTGPGFQFDTPENIRDVKHLGDIEESVSEFAKLLGWEEEMQSLIAQAKVTKKQDHVSGDK
jgi:NAD+-dependent protein deacetylase sirtuin 2